jgi:hypothetical protein
MIEQFFLTFGWRLEGNKEKKETLASRFDDRGNQKPISTIQQRSTPPDHH